MDSSPRYTGSRARALGGSIVSTCCYSWPSCFSRWCSCREVDVLDMHPAATSVDLREC